MPLSDDTVLRFSVGGVPRFSARGAVQTLTPIQASGTVRRTVNGELKSLSNDRFQKFSSSITVQDERAPPALDGIWPGMTIVVDCISELGYETGKAGAPHKTVVAGSPRTEQGFTFYRPKLTMKVISYSQTKDEWGAVNGWSMELEEV